MREINWENVIVQELFYSKNARKGYSFAPQRRGIGKLDLRGVETERQFLALWREEIGLVGEFALLGMWKKPCRIAKRLAEFRVTGGGVEWKDRRCAFLVRLRRSEGERFLEREAFRRI